METAIVSPEFHVAIPQAIQEALGLQPGQKVQVMLYQSRIELIAVRSVREMHGFLKGIDTTVKRGQTAHECRRLLWMVGVLC